MRTSLKSSLSTGEAGSSSAAIPARKAGCKNLLWETNLHLLPHLLWLCPTDYEGWFLISHKIRRCTQKLPWNPAMLSHESWRRRQRLSESRVRALCHSPAATDGPQLLILCPQGRVLLEYEFRALRWQHQTALKGFRSSGRSARSEPPRAAATEKGPGEQGGRGCQKLGAVRTKRVSALLPSSRLGSAAVGMTTSGLHLNVRFTGKQKKSKQGTSRELELEVKLWWLESLRLWQLFPKGFRMQAVIYTPLSSGLWREGLRHSSLQELDPE